MANAHKIPRNQVGAPGKGAAIVTRHAKSGNSASKPADLVTVEHGQPVTTTERVAAAAGLKHELPDGLQLAAEMIGEYVEGIIFSHRHPVTGELPPHAEIDQQRGTAAIAAIRAEHAKRVAMQHHAVDLEQQIEDLRFAAESGGRRIDELMELNDFHLDSLMKFKPLGEYMQALDAIRKLPASVHGRHISDVAIERMQEQEQRIADLEAERNTARGAVRELERQVFALQQQRDVLQTCLDRHQRDEADPPGYLQDAVIRAAGLGALHTERDAAIKERDALRARLAEIEAQEPVMYVLRSAASRPQPSVVTHQRYLSVAISDRVDEGLDHLDPLYASPTVPAQAGPEGERQSVPLKDEQVAAVVALHWGRADIAPQSVCEFARSIESAVLAASGLEVRRG